MHVGAPGRVALGRASGVVLGVCVALPFTGVEPAAADGRTPVVVGFGDSVPAGARCGCATFLQQYADRVGSATATKPEVDNLAANGSTSTDLVKLLATDRARRAVQRATVVVVMVGANDYKDAFRAVGSGASPEQYQRVAAQVKVNVANAIATIKTVNSRAGLVVADYWAAMEDGAVARHDYTRPQLVAARKATESLNHALSSATSAAGVGWVSTQAAFRRHGRDDTDLLLSDGDHPNAAGTTVIAKALAAVLPRG